MLFDAEKREAEAHETHSQAGGGWFYAIGALSLVNSVAQALGSERTFLAGLGVTQLIDGVAAGLGQGLDGSAATVLRVIGFGLDIVAAGLFLLLGWEARDGKRWAFLVGLVLYGLDGAIFLLVGEWIGLAFHGLVFYWILRGYRSTARAEPARAEAA